MEAHLLSFEAWVAGFVVDLSGWPHREPLMWSFAIGASVCNETEANESFISLVRWQFLVFNTV